MLAESILTLNLKYPYHAAVWLGEDPDAPGAMVHVSANVRFVRGRWYADVVGLLLGCVGVFGIRPLSDSAFVLPQTWAATVVPDDGPEYLVIVTGWDGERWIGSDGPIEGLIDNPTPAPDPNEATGTG